MEFVPVDSMDGQVSEAEEMAEFLTLNISAKDKAAFAYADDQTRSGSGWQKGSET